jgi:hypothetical protein
MGNRNHDSHNFRGQVLRPRGGGVSLWLVVWTCFCPLNTLRLTPTLTPLGFLLFTPAVPAKKKK